ncbi:MAG: type II secretion system protein [Betaproteobacteria bacterium]
MRSTAGFTYVAILIFIAVFTAGTAAMGMSWQRDQIRDKEAELLFIGEEFRQAIGNYYLRTPGGSRDYPKSLDELLADERFINKPRYLRKIYVDPITGQKDWGLILSPSGRIMGVHSSSNKTPMKSGGFDAISSDFSKATGYSDWKFVYIPPIP